MRPIPTVFQPDPRTHLATPEVRPECAWVLRGEGRPTVKLDGEACYVLEGRLYRRHRVREGRAKPEGWLQAEGEYGWAPVLDDDPATAPHREAFATIREDNPGSWGGSGLLHAGWGTFELLGPKVQGNPYGLPRHRLVPHGVCPEDLRPYEWHYASWVLDKPRYYHIEDALAALPDAEGIVFHHPDGRKAKVRRKDFGMAWPPA